jgi:hypothetical protein
VLQQVEVKLEGLVLLVVQRCAFTYWFRSVESISSYALSLLFCMRYLVLCTSNLNFKYFNVTFCPSML